MKQCFHIIKKIAVGFAINLLMVLSGILTLVDTVIQVVSDVLLSIVNMAKSFVAIGAILLLIFYIFTEDPFYDSLRRGYAIVGVILFSILGLWLLTSIVPAIAEILAVILILLRPQKMIDYLSAGALWMVDIYESGSEDDQDAWGYYIGGPVIVMDFMGKIFRFAISVAAVIGLPVLFGRWGYLQSFSEGMRPPETFCLEWWTAIGIAVLCAAYGLATGCSVSRAIYRCIQSEEEETV